MGLRPEWRYRRCIRSGAGAVLVGPNLDSVQISGLRSALESPFRLAPTIQNGTFMNINLSLAPLVSLVAGILILTVPRLLNYIVAIYLIVIGLIGLIGANNLSF
jgi:hypothetical protein